MAEINVKAGWRVADVVTKDGVTPMVIRAIELVKVLELAASVFPEAKDSVSDARQLIFQVPYLLPEQGHLSSQRGYLFPASPG